MNYLAHLVLSPGSPLLLAGALAGDFVHGRLSDEVHAELRSGIELHRAIDAFADSHPALAQSRRRLGAYRHHARIIVDVFYDWFLARDFERLTGEALSGYVDRVNAALLEAVDRGGVPPPVERLIANLVRHRALASYGELASVERALGYLSTRLRRPVALATATEELRKRPEEYREDFELFWPEVVRFAAERRKG